MATLYAHGSGAIKGWDSTFTIDVTAFGFALIQPASPDNLSGWIYYAIPSPTPNTPNLQNVVVDFTSQSAVVDQVQVSFGDRFVQSVSDLGKRQSFETEIYQQYCGL